MIQAVDGLVLQVFYKSGDKEILIRKALVSQGKDISGDYNVYDVTKKVSVKGKRERLRSKERKRRKILRYGVTEPIPILCIQVQE